MSVGLIGHSFNKGYNMSDFQRDLLRTLDDLSRIDDRKKAIDLFTERINKILPELRIEYARDLSDRDDGVNKIHFGEGRDGLVVIGVSDQPDLMEILRSASNILSAILKDKRSDEPSQQLQKSIHKNHRNFRESVENFKKLTEATSTAIMIYQDDKYVYANPTAQSISGYSEDELKKMNFYNFVSPEQKEMVKGFGRLRQAGKEAKSGYELKIITKKGEERWVYVEASLTEFNGRPAVLLSVIDIDKRKRTEEELEDIKERYKALFDRSLDAVFINDLEGNFVDANETALKLLGYKRSEIPDLNYMNLLSEDQLSKAFEDLEEILRTGTQSKLRTLYLRRKDRNKVTVETKASLILKDGKPYGILGIGRDVTEKKRVEKELKKSEKKFRSVINQANEGIVMVNQNGIVTAWNEKESEFTGITEEEALGRPIWELIGGMTGSDKAKLHTAKKITDYMEGRMDMEPFVIKQKIPDGTYHYLEHSVYRVNMGDETIFTHSSRDVTEMREKERAAREEKERAEFYLDLLGHDLGNIHQGISGALELIKFKTKNREDLKRPINLAVDAARRSRDLTRNVMFLSRVRSSDQSVSHMDLGDSIQDALESAISLFPEKNVNTDIDLNGHSVVAEPILKEMFFNLFHNALRLQDDPWIGISAVDNGENIRISISDKGPGIPDDMKRNLFTKFGMKGRKSRTGLGLSIVKALVDRYGGSIEVRDRVDGDHEKGTTFVIYLKKPDEDH